MKKLQKQQSGFTIIEVLIVLAIAGLIMLIVFLAVPALQRNSRNSQRNNEASRIAGLVNECLSNRNGQIASCDTTGELNTSSQTLTQFTAVNVSTTTTAPASSTTAIGVWYGRKCLSDGSGADTAANSSARDVSVLFTLEPNVTRCVSS